MDDLSFVDDINEIFGSETIKAADLKGKRHRLCIATVAPIQFNDSQKPKLKITFQNAKKAFICNATNGKIIATRYGNKFKQWTGKEIILYPDLKNFQGKITEGISVALPDLPEDVSAPTPQVAVQQRDGYSLSTTERHPNAPSNDMGEQDIPF